MAKSTSKLFSEEDAKEMKDGDMNLPEEEDKSKVVAFPEEKDDDIQDIDMSIIKKQRFRINGDNNKILELNVSDMGIARRLSISYKRLNKLMDETADMFAGTDDENMSDEEFEKLGETLDEIDKKMGAELDYVFNADVYKIFSTDGSMWDPIDGAFRYEHIIDRLAKLYENNLDKEFANMKRRVDTKTGKYTKVKAKNK